MKKFVLVPYAQFQRDKRQGEEKLEKGLVPDFEKGEISLPPYEESPPPPNGTLSLQGDSSRREERQGPPITVPLQQVSGDRKVTKQPTPLQFSEIGEGAKGEKTPPVKRKRRRRVAPRTKTVPLSDPQHPSSVEEDKNNGRVPATLQAPSAKFWIRP